VSFPSSLRARITIAAVLAVALAGAVAGTALVAAVERDGRSAVDNDLRARVARIAPGTSDVGGDGFDGPGWGPRGRGPERLLVGAGTFAQVAFFSPLGSRVEKKNRPSISGSKGANTLAPPALMFSRTTATPWPDPTHTPTAP